MPTNLFEFDTTKDKRKVKTYRRIMDNNCLSDSSDEEDDNVDNGKRRTRNPRPLYKAIIIEDSDDEKDTTFDEDKYDEEKDTLSNVVP